MKMKKKKIKKSSRSKSIRTKILLGFSVVILLVLVLGGVNYYAINKINDDTSEIVDDQLPDLVAEERLAFNMAQQIALTRAYVLFGDEDYKQRFDQYTEQSNQYAEMILANNPSEEVEDLINRNQDWRETVKEEVFSYYDRAEEELARMNLRYPVQPLARQIMEDFEEAATIREEEIQQQGQTILESGRTLLYVSLGIAALAILLGSVTAGVTSHRIIKPIRLVMDRMNLVASGDLSQEALKSKQQDEIGQLIEATNTMNRNTRELLSEINSVSEHVSSQSEELTQSANEVRQGSEQIASTMQELASGTESQANSAGDLSSMMETFTEKMQEANSNGEAIYQVSNQVLTKTDEGNKLMDSSVEQMNQIDQIVKQAVVNVKGLDEQSQQISKLVSVIKDIAEQTNLLALNAAIEAARAGEHGRGFAVVADEVRKLAEQVAVSVTDITGIVTSIQTETKGVTDSLQSGYEEVEKGTNQIKTTGQTFEEIEKAVKEMVTSITTVSDNLATMSTSSQEMHASVEEIASVSEESAAGVEETSASAERSSSSMEEIAGNSDQLAKLAENLNALVRRFKL